MRLTRTGPTTAPAPRTSTKKTRLSRAGHVPTAGRRRRGTHTRGTHTRGTHTRGTHRRGTRMRGTHTRGTHMRGTHTTTMLATRRDLRSRDARPEGWRTLPTSRPPGTSCASTRARQSCGTWWRGGSSWSRTRRRTSTANCRRNPTWTRRWTRSARCTARGATTTTATCTAAGTSCPS